MTERNGANAVKAIRDRNPGAYTKYSDSEMLDAIKRKNPGKYDDLVVQDSITPTGNVLERSAKAAQKQPFPYLNWLPGGKELNQSLVEGQQSMEEQHPGSTSSNREKQFTKELGGSVAAGMGAGTVAKNALPWLAKTGLGSQAALGAVEGVAAAQPFHYENMGDRALGTAGASVLGAALPVGIAGAKGAYSLGKKAVGRVSEAFKAPGELANVRSQIPQAKANLEDARMAQSEVSQPYSDESSRGVRIIKEADKRILSDLESNKTNIVNNFRNKIVSSVKGVKEKTAKWTSDFYNKYDTILEAGEKEAAEKGISSEAYQREVIDPVMDKIAQDGADTTASKSLQSKMKVKRGKDPVSGEMVDIQPEIPSTIEQMKNLKNSVGKYGQGDYIANMLHDRHRAFIGKYSDIVSKANKSYGEVSNAVKFSKKSIVPHNPAEIKKAADLLVKEATGGLNETEAAYLKTIKEGKGEFAGAGELLDDATKEAASKMSSEIAALKKQIESVKAQSGRDIATVKGASSEAKYSNKLTESASKQSSKRNVLTHSKKLSDLENLEKELQDKVRLRSKLIWGGLGAAGVSTGLAKTVLD